MLAFLVTSPHTEVADLTTTYYAATDSDLGKRGHIATVSNALGHVTRTNDNGSE